MTIGLVTALSLATGLAPAWGQETDHASHHPEAKPAATQSSAKPVDPHAGHEPTPPDRSSNDHGTMDHGSMDHGTMEHGSMEHGTADPDGNDHSTMDHSGMNHSGMDDSPMDHGSMGHQPGASQDLPATVEPHEPIPVITPADRAAAFQDLDEHVMHGTSIHSYWALDRLEAWDADEDGTGIAWEAKGWVGSDLNRLWLRSEGERAGGSTESADVEVLYGRAIAPWWDAVAGVRHDFGFGGGPSRTYAALGVIGLAPYKFEVEATAYLGESGQVGLGAEAEYEMLFTNRLIGQWLVEGEAWSKDDPAVGIGSGLSKVEAGFRLRYEFHRQFAPYVGVVWERAYGGTADQRRAQSGDIDDTRIVAGVRIWF
ncbi:copper resistance protein B [Luteimonas granuli]|nr:copper resistance protein B [Luteimonas granuli]